MLKIDEWKAKIFKILGAIKLEGLNMIAKIGYGHMCNTNREKYA
jgi:hypothetical protein